VTEEGTPPADERISQLKRALVTTAGGFLRNPVTQETCSRCFTPLATGTMCAECLRQTDLGSGPDLVGVMTYAGYLDPIRQSGYMMRGYKDPNFPEGAHWQTVALLAALGLNGHINCPGKILGTPVSAWATVPSLPAKPSDHPLNDIVRRLARQGAIELVLQGAARATNPRAINADHFIVVNGSAAAGRHVLLADDTWTSGGHVTSAAMALRASGCEFISVLVLARWLSIGWADTTETWARSRLVLPDYQADVCPWTQAQCP
jgi:predicted amidophosphoribosyltransferase